MNKLNMDKTAFTRLLKNKGFDSVRAFADACHMVPQQIFTYVRERYKPSLAVMFVMADVLGVPIDDVIETFYEEEMQKNRESSD